KSAKVVPSQKLSLSYANQFNRKAMPIGLVSSFTYKYNRNLEANKHIRTVRAYNSTLNKYLTRSNYRSDVGMEKVKMGGMLNLFIKPSPTIKIGLKNLYINSLKNATHIIEGHYFNYPSLTRQTIFDFDRRSVLSST